MKIIFNKNDMCEAVSPLQSGVSGKTALTATEGILFEAQAPDVCRMTTFDLEKGVRLSVRVEVIEEGAAIISAAKFSQTVRAMEDGEITLSVDDRNCVSITCGRASHTMNALPAADFPDLPRLRSVNGFTVPRKTLRTMIGKCMHAMGTNDQRPFLNGMYMRVTDGRLDTVACDSFRMAVCSTPAETENRNESGDALNYRFILPNKSVGELFRLLETVLDARNRRQPNGTTHWKTLADLVRHPYLRLLEANGISLRDIFQNMETRLRNGSRHADAHAVAEGAADDFFAASSLPNVAEAMPAIRELLNRILRDTVDTWARVHTLGGLADALSGLCDTLLVYGSGNDEDGAGNGKADIWSRFPIDAECLFRLMQRVIPALKDNGMADTPLPWPLMQAMLLELVRAERVPFEADPLTGLQVLGMLETRLLRFSRVFLVDVTDDRLPGAPIRSPLLPDSLRALLGLPDTRNREQLAAYTFHRLIAGADEVWLYWQEGVETSGLFDGKKQRSRLVEELIWQEEQARGQRLKPGREPLRTAALDVRPPVRVRKVVPKTPAIREQIAASLKHPLSATRLDAYLTCPLRYYYERLCAIAPIDEVNEDDDPAAVGVLLHNVLRDFYAPAVGKTVRRDAQSGDPELPFLDEKALRALFRTALDASGLEAALPPESAAMLSVTGPERLGMFLRAQPEQTEVLSLEEEYDAEIRVGGRIRRLTGNLDRVDWREQEDPEGAIDEGAVILDYKTGRIKALRPDIWADDAFWDALDPEKAAEAASEPDPEHDFLPIMAQRIPTVQLLYYCYLYGQATGKPVLDAAFVALGEDGGERPLFGKGMTIEERERALSLIPRLIGFILLHMELCPEFRPREGAHCRWCSWRNVCIISSQQ